MRVVNELAGWLKLFAVWALIGVFFGVLIGVGIVVARGIVWLFGLVW